MAGDLMYASFGQNPRSTWEGDSLEKVITEQSPECCKGFYNKANMSSEISDI